MKAYTRRRLLASVKLGLAAIPFWMALTLAEGRAIDGGTFVLSFGIGFAVGAAELFLLRTWLRDLPFVSHLAVKSLAITVVIYLAAAALNVLDVIIDGLTWQAYAETMSAELMAELRLGPEYVVKELGPVQLRGKGRAAKLYAVSRANGNRLDRS